MSKTKWFIFVILTLGFLGFLVITTKSSKLDVSNIDANIAQIANDQNGNIADHIFGNTASKVTLIEYADFQCPGCATINPTIVEIRNYYKDQVQFIFRNFPLSTIHPNAKLAAASAEAAGLQGKYWEIHDKIYEDQANWSNLIGDDRTNFFKKYANDFSLDADKFLADISSNSINSKINYDYALGVKSGVDATPSFFLNGTKVDTKVWGDIEQLKGLINGELEKAGIKLP